MRKPNAGSCGICGAAVVKPDKVPEGEDRVWVDGHLFELFDGALKLKRVRCMQHATDYLFDRRLVSIW